MSRRRLTPALRAYRIRRLTVEQVLTALRQPTLQAAPGVADAVAARIASLVPQLRLVHAQRLTTDRDIDRALASLAAEPLEPTRRLARPARLDTPATRRARRGSSAAAARRERASDAREIRSGHPVLADVRIRAEQRLKIPLTPGNRVNIRAHKDMRSE
jgi:hypothetical protein